MFRLPFKDRRLVVCTVEGLHCIILYLRVLSKAKVNFVFTTHFPELKEIVKQNLPLHWGVFEATYTVHGAKSKSRQVISYTYKLRVKDSDAKDENEVHV